MNLKRQLGLPTAILVVVASMIGTGIFITTGDILDMTHHALVVLVLWAVAGLVAITGALCYAELAATWPEAGGEYVYLKNTFGYLPAFLTGWISLVVGFSAPVALSAIAFVEYINKFWQNLMVANGQDTLLFANVLTQKTVAAGVVVLLSIIHILGVKEGGMIQNVLTIIKLAIVATFIGFGVYMADWGFASRLTAEYPVTGGDSLAGIPVIGLALLIIMYSYSGWNGAAYIAGEIKQPEKNLPKALFFGTLITAVLYIGLNVVFLMAVPGQKLLGQEAVGAIAAKSLFGVHVSHFFTLGIALILLSSISVQMMIGPRVYYAMATDRMMFRPLSRIHPMLGTPMVAIGVQMFLAIVYVYVGSARTLMEYMGFALLIFPLLAIIGLVVLRRKHPELRRPYRVPFYPWTPLVYIVLTLSMMIAAVFTWVRTSWFAIGVVLVGIPVFFLWKKVSSGKNVSD